MGYVVLLSNATVSDKGDKYCTPDPEDYREIVKQVNNVFFNNYDLNKQNVFYIYI